MSTGRSPTARRVWIWLDAADPREAAALVAFDRMQATMPGRVRAGLMRDAVCRAILDIVAGGPVGVDQPATARPVRAKRMMARTAVEAAGVPVVKADQPARDESSVNHPVETAKVEPVPVVIAPVEAGVDPSGNNKPADGQKPGGLMW
ncbi:hypothetical protein [Acidiphilium acidophilum]|uniref:hypothetical protein n=1 Tax=Acidiphilium acidophilum TaxID=76588 RepID=UPI002E8E72EE|nr:hypothetical protein [Acidiphilium acidophilum]